MIETENAFDHLLSRVKHAAQLLESRDPLTTQTRAALANLLRGLGGIVVEAEGMTASMRQLRARLAQKVTK